MLRHLSKIQSRLDPTGGFIFTFSAAAGDFEVHVEQLWTKEFFRQCHNVLTLQEKEINECRALIGV